MTKDKIKAIGILMIGIGVLIFSIAYLINVLTPINKPVEGIDNNYKLEPMSLKNFEFYYNDRKIQNEVIQETLQRIKKNPNEVERYLKYWKKQVEFINKSPYEFPKENEWNKFKSFSSDPQSKTFYFEYRKGNYSEDGYVVIKDGKIIYKHVLRSGTIFTEK